MLYSSELVTWSSTYSVGVKIIDDQHKELLNLTNDLYNHCVGDPEQEREYFKKVINAAVKYVKVHFSTEERIMLATHYPGLGKHKMEHDAFVKTVVDEVHKFHAGQPFTLVEFTRYLKNWILTHIAVSDKGYFVWFRQIATRKANGRLSITEADVERGAQTNTQMSPRVRKFLETKNMA